MPVSNIEHWNLKVSMSQIAHDIDRIDDLIIIALASPLAEDWDRIEYDLRNRYAKLNPINKIIYTAGILAAKINLRESGVSFRNFNSLLDAQKLDFWNALYHSHSSLWDKISTYVTIRTDACECGSVAQLSGSRRIIVDMVGYNDFVDFEKHYVKMMEETTHQSCRVQNDCCLKKVRIEVKLPSVLVCRVYNRAFKPPKDYIVHAVCSQNKGIWVNRPQDNVFFYLEDDNAKIAFPCDVILIQKNMQMKYQL